MCPPSGMPLLCPVNYMAVLALVPFVEPSFLVPSFRPVDAHERTADTASVVDGTAWAPLRNRLDFVLIKFVPSHLPHGHASNMLCLSFHSVAACASVVAFGSLGP